MKRDSARALVMLLALTFTAGACTATTPSGSDETTSSPSERAATTASVPPPSASNRVLPTASEPPRPSPAGTPAPTPSATPASSDTTGLEIRWAHEPITGIGQVVEIKGVARAGDTFVLLASLPSHDETSPQAAIWRSSDGASWVQAKAFPPNVDLRTIAAAGPGYVAAGGDEDGGAVWTSPDGRDWQPVSDASLRNGRIDQLVVTESGVVGFGWLSDHETHSIWTSRDGVEWLAATNETGLTVARGLQAVGSYGGRAVAFVSNGNDEPPAIWETTGRADWSRVGALQEVASISRVAGGPAGWVAIGDSRAWTSNDGRSWSNGAPGPDVYSDLLVDEAGFIAVGYVGSLPGETCGDQRPFAAHTWTSVDGSVWTRMPVTKSWRSAMISKLAITDRSIVGFGQLIGDDYSYALDVARWIAPLPELAVPTAESDEASVYQSCGG